MGTGTENQRPYEGGDESADDGGADNSGVIPRRVMSLLMGIVATVEV